MFSSEDHHFMQQAIQLAQKANALGEVPVGALLVCENKVISEGWNSSIADCDPSAHAEVNALRKGAHVLKNYRLINTTLYVTLEPCLMCFGAIIHARVARVIFGAYDPRGGAVQSAFTLGDTDKLNHRPQYLGGLLESSCAVLLKEFFRIRRCRVD